MRLIDIHWWTLPDQATVQELPKPKKRTNKAAWTAQELQSLHKHWQTMSTGEMAVLLGRTKSAVASRGRELQLKKTPDSLKRLRAKRGHTRTDGWTEVELQYLRDNWETQTRNQIAAHLGRTAGAVKRMAYHLRLLKTDEAKRIIYQRPNSGQFQKGQSPKNTIYGDEQVIRTRHNKKRDVYAKYIRIGFRQWKEYKHYIWEQANGPVPKGKILAFINGDPMDCRLDNLELITRRENALRNSGSLNLSDGYVAHTLAWHDKPMQEELLKHPELIELKRSQLKLNRAIRNESSSHSPGGPPPADER